MPTTRSQTAAFTGSQDSRPETIIADPVLPGQFVEPQPSQYVAYTSATEDNKDPTLHSPDTVYPTLPPMDDTPTPAGHRPAPSLDSFDLESNAEFSDTLDEADFVPSPALVRHDNDPSTQYNLRVSVNALSHMARMASAKLPADAETLRARAIDMQVALHQLGTIKLARLPDQPGLPEQLNETQLRLNEEAAQRRELQVQLDAETALRGEAETRRQEAESRYQEAEARFAAGAAQPEPIAVDRPAIDHLHAMQLRLDEELNRRRQSDEQLTQERRRADAATLQAADTRRLLDEHRAVFDRMAAISTTDAPNQAARAPGTHIKTPDPPVFSKGRVQYRVFRSKLRAKFQADGDRFRDELHRVNYAMGFLEGDAYAIAQPLMEVGTISTIEGLLTFMDSTFEDPDRKGTAKRAIQALRQGRADFVSHFTRFQALMVDLTWTEEARLSALHDSLSAELQVALAHSLPPEDESFDQFASRARRLDVQLRRLAVSQVPAFRPGAPYRPPQAAQAATTAAPSSGAAAQTPTPGPRAGKPRPPLSAEERARRVADNLCLYCGGPGHRADSCALVRGRPLRAAATGPGSDAGPTIEPAGNAST